MFATFPKARADAMSEALLGIAGIELPRFAQFDEDTDKLCLQIGCDKEPGTAKAVELTGLPGEWVKMGDGPADIPLMRSVPGPNVVMGNATDEELRSIADYIAPSVYDHGYVDALHWYELI